MPAKTELKELLRGRITGGWCGGGSNLYTCCGAVSKPVGFKNLQRVLPQGRDFKGVVRH